MTNGCSETKVDWIPGLTNFRLKDILDYNRTNDIIVEFYIEIADRIKG